MELLLSLVCNNNNITNNKVLYEDIIWYVYQNISKIAHVETHTVAVLFKEIIKHAQCNVTVRKTKSLKCFLAF